MWKEAGCHTSTKPKPTLAYPHLGGAIDLGCKVLWAMVAMATDNQRTEPKFELA